MASFNRIVLLGNLTRDPQLKHLPSNTALCEFGLAVNHRYKTASGDQRDEAMFIDCACFGKGAEIINQYCQKGKQLLVEGRLKLDSWEDKNGGGRRSRHSIIVENFQLMGARPEGYGDDEPPRRQQARPPARRQTTQQHEPPASDEVQFSDEDIPF